MVPVGRIYGGSAVVQSDGLWYGSQVDGDARAHVCNSVVPRSGAPRERSGVEDAEDVLPFTGSFVTAVNGVQVCRTNGGSA